MNIEVEKRAFLSKKQYVSLPKKILDLGGNDLGKNNTDTVFYILDNSQLKVQKLISKKKAKIAWKSGSFNGNNTRREIEYQISIDDFNVAIDLYDSLFPEKRKIISNQLRSDYALMGVNIAIKYSDNWGYHAEFEVLINKLAERNNALKLIKSVADILEVQLLTKQQELRHAKSVIKKQSK